MQKKEEDDEKKMMTATVLVFLNQIKTQKVKRSANFNQTIQKNPSFVSNDQRVWMCVTASNLAAGIKSTAGTLVSYWVMRAHMSCAEHRRSHRVQQ